MLSLLLIWKLLDRKVKVSADHTQVRVSTQIDSCRILNDGVIVKTLNNKIKQEIFKLTFAFIQSEIIH